MGKVTEKEFEDLAARLVDMDTHMESAISYQNFELAKQLAVDFRKWYIIQERAGNREIYGKIPEDLLKLYLKSNE